MNVGRSYLVGNRHCYVEQEPAKDVSLGLQYLKAFILNHACFVYIGQQPCNIWKYMFTIEDAISVHAMKGWTEQEVVCCVLKYFALLNDRIGREGAYIIIIVATISILLYEHLIDS